MGQFTNTGAGANPLLQSLLQGIFASGAPQQGLGMGGIQRQYQPPPGWQAGYDRARAQGMTQQGPQMQAPAQTAYRTYMSPYGPGAVTAQEAATNIATGAYNPNANVSGDLPQWQGPLPTGVYDVTRGPTLPPGGGYPVMPPFDVGGLPMPPNPGSQVRPPWMAGGGPVLPPTIGYPVQPPWIFGGNGGPIMPPNQGSPLMPPFDVGGPTMPPYRGSLQPPPLTVPQPGSTFVNQPNPFQKSINVMNNGNPMDVFKKKPGIL